MVGEVIEMAITPTRIENRLYELSKEIDLAHEELSKAEMDYHKAKSAFDTAKQQVALLEKFLKQKYKGKRKITKKQKAEAAELLLVQQMRAKRAEKRYKKWQKAASF